MDVSLSYNIKYICPCHAIIAHDEYKHVKETIIIIQLSASLWKNSERKNKEKSITSIMSLFLMFLLVCYIIYFRMI